MSHVSEILYSLALAQWLSSTAQYLVPTKVIDIVSVIHRSTRNAAVALRGH